MHSLGHGRGDTIVELKESADILIENSNHSPFIRKTSIGQDMCIVLSFTVAQTWNIACSYNEFDLFL